ncbi:hypothetical protein DFA_02332 [Cavenderia fasciculata]|uniref:Uncharacterized protein n=1 Tax=Cavenderia fasciculata TaxID=261658 RepID=F4PZ57_CACFS|nr:uncharacterized protein DFA_02332 [Cavenderia fasciculata]EGG19086.1 hypothetical protein DFA_02332 [Cavenderia fasciculata]|eukprot:XP_004366719.1 hypothetical protein DFA_02332 [Cavenderia fasciculata]
MDTDYTADGHQPPPPALPPPPPQQQDQQDQQQHEPLPFEGLSVIIDETTQTLPNDPPSRLRLWTLFGLVELGMEEMVDNHISLEELLRIINSIPADNLGDEEIARPIAMRDFVSAIAFLGMNNTNTNTNGLVEGVAKAVKDHRRDRSQIDWRNAYSMACVIDLEKELYYHSFGRVGEYLAETVNHLIKIVSLKVPKMMQDRRVALNLLYIMITQCQRWQDIYNNHHDHGHHHFATRLLGSHWLDELERAKDTYLEDDSTRVVASAYKLALSSLLYWKTSDNNNNNNKNKNNAHYVFNVSSANTLDPAAAAYHAPDPHQMMTPPVDPAALVVPISLSTSLVLHEFGENNYNQPQSEPNQGIQVGAHITTFVNSRFLPVPVPTLEELLETKTNIENVVSRSEKPKKYRILQACRLLGIRPTVHNQVDLRVVYSHLQTHINHSGGND